MVSITTKDKVGINGKVYTLAEPLTEMYMPRSPSVVTVGSNSYSRENRLSNWINADLRGGIGIDEMELGTTNDRYWWSDCSLGNIKHLRLGRLSTAITTFDTGGVTPTWTLATAASGANWNDTGNSWDNNTGTFAYTNAVGTASWSGYLTMTFPLGWYGRLKFWVNRVSTYITTVEVDASKDGASWTSIYNATPTFNDWVTTDMTDIECIYLRIRGYNPDATHTDVFRIHECQLETVATSAVTTETPVKLITFNSILYGAFGTYLVKLNAGRTAFGTVYKFPATVTDLIVYGSKLYIYLGDATNNYYVMTTAEAFTQSDSSAAYYGVSFGGYLWKIKSTGQLAYSSDPDAGSPTWTAGGTLSDYGSGILGLSLGRDGNGIQRIYGVCQASSLKIYDDSSSHLWQPTELKIVHPLSGYGYGWWNNAFYLSNGLGVEEYSPGSTATISSIGLDQEAGLPSEYGGGSTSQYISRFCTDWNAGLLATVCNNTGSGKSAIFKYDGIGWQVMYADSTNSAYPITKLTVSTASSSYAIYFARAGASTPSVSYIDIPYGNTNPVYSTTNYNTSGTFFTSWFDADNVGFPKLLKRLTTYASGVTTTETITISYRINHTTTGISTAGDWTTLATLDTTGENGKVETEIASGAGLLFYSIQFKVALARGSTATLSPDLNAFVIGYEDYPASENDKMWVVKVNLDGLHGETKEQQYDSLWTAITSQTHIPFIYRSETTETHYGRLFPETMIPGGGKDYKGIFTLRFVEI